jgi:hypothetical protein
MHPLTLRFPGDLEGTFLEDYFHKSLNPIRFSLVLGSCFSPCSVSWISS